MLGYGGQGKGEMCVCVCLSCREIAKECLSVCVFQCVCALSVCKCTQ